MFAYRQSAAGGPESDNVTLNSVQAGSLIVVFFYSFYSGGSYGTVTCSDGTSLSECTPAVGSYEYIKAFYQYSSGGGNKTYTITGEHDYYGVCAFEFSYAGSCELDAQNQGYGDATGSVATGNITTTGAGSELVIACAVSYASGNLNTPRINNVAADGSLDLTIGSGDGLAWYRIVSSTFTGNASCTDSDLCYWVANVISFKEVSAGGTSSTPLFRRRMNILLRLCLSAFNLIGRCFK